MRYQTNYQTWISHSLILVVMLITVAMVGCQQQQPSPTVIYEISDADPCPPKPALWQIRSDELKALSDLTKQKLLENQIRIKGHIAELRTFCTDLEKSNDK